MTTQAPVPTANAIIQRYEKLHPKSKLLAAQAVTLFPDGVTHQSRKYGPFPVYMDHGKGPRKWDVDGNEYIDYRTGHGSMLLGQAHPAVVKAVQDQVAKGTHLSSGTELEVKWAQAVKRLVPSVEKVRFTSSGTEANMMAFRIARRFTGKEKIVKFKGSFHGWSDEEFSSDAETNRRFGIPHTVSESVVIVDWNDLNALEKTLAGSKDIAGVVLQGDRIMRPEYVKGVEQLCRQHGVLFLMDEVVSGFRWSRSGAQGFHGVRPDLSTMGKILSGGLPGGAVGGRADLMDMIGPHGIAHPGTFNANPVSAAAGTAALGIVEREPVGERAEQQARRLRAGLTQLLKGMEVPGGAYGISSVAEMSIGQDLDLADPFAEPGKLGGQQAGQAVIELLHLAMINEGLWGHPYWLIMSSTHTDKDVDMTIEKFGAALKAVRKEGLI
jgi:glutamate-1-semialdehyde 2,1-aminomutase